MKTLLALLLAGLLANPGAAQSVLVVDDDGGPGVDFINLQDAIDAAVDGDILLVRPGTYTGSGVFGASPIEIDGKGLALGGDGGKPQLTAGLHVTGIPAGSSVFVRNFSLPCDNKLVLSASDGAIWLEDVSVAGSCSGVFSETYTSISACDQVFFNRCTLDGGGGFPFAATTSPAVTASNSGVHVYDSTIRGGGSNGISPSSHGYKLQGGSLMVSGSTVQGGGSSIGVPCGGPGIWLASGNPQVWTLDTLVIGGKGPCGQDAIQVDAGTHTPFAGSARSFQSQSPLRAGQTSTISFDGMPGDFVLLFVSLDAGAFFKSKFHGTFQTGVPFLQTFALGTLRGTGQLEITVPIDPFPAGIDGVEIFMQTAHFEAGGQGWLSSASAQVVVHQDF